MTRLTVGQRVDWMLSCAWLRRVVTCIGLIGIGLTAGALNPPPHSAWGQGRDLPMPPAFKSGDQLSLPILEDIAATLHQIDNRMARLEIVFKELTKPRPSSANRN